MTDLVTKFYKTKGRKKTKLKTNRFNYDCGQEKFFFLKVIQQIGFTSSTQLQKLFTTQHQLILFINY